jgi:hypothetical protein
MSCADRTRVSPFNLDKDKKPGDLTVDGREGPCEKEPVDSEATCFRTTDCADDEDEKDDEFDTDDAEDGDEGSTSELSSGTVSSEGFF